MLLRISAHVARRSRRAPYIRLSGFLPGTIADEMLCRLVDRQLEFRIRGHELPHGGGTFYRMSRPFADPQFVRQLPAVFVEAERLFAVDLSNPEVELCAQAYNDGSVFHLHSDATAGGPNWQRRVSGVYFLHRRPRQFHGGELAIYDDDGKRYLVAPDHNSIVLFSRTAPHEVLPVSCTSGRFEDSRFAINIWVS
jgi:2OG-Fe(II) oxygenase superfamily